jgi:DMSO/TMAO reductase YedYZ molybdopterin-dependent catalytic subunit
MSDHPRFPSLFRPSRRIDQSILSEHRSLVADIDRRGLLRGTISLGALTLLTGCDISNEDHLRTALTGVSSWNDRVQAALFGADRLAPTYSEDQVVKPPRFNAYYPIDKVKSVDVSTWTLELAGLVDNKTPWTAAALAALPETELIIRHVCVEGWDYIGQWSGPLLRTFLERVGADLKARYIGFHCADGYTSSIAMATALHPQTILATKYARAPIADPFGSPVRLRTSTKLGFKNPKWITALEITNDYPGGYWEDRGYSWFAGL